MAQIVLVDDNEGVLTTIQLLLKARHDDEVALYTSPEELLRAMDQGMRPDLVITDYSMPGMNGGELLTSIARRDESIPGIVITGYPEGLDALAGRYPILCKGTRDFIPTLLKHVKIFLSTPTTASAERLLAGS
ncbi:MAG: response regulator [Chitinivibrionales bacterium]|nr:response regulator [Chitinivibrionales bacterium]